MQQNKKRTYLEALELINKLPAHDLSEVASHCTYHNIEETLHIGGKTNISDKQKLIDLIQTRLCKIFIENTIK